MIGQRPRRALLAVAAAVLLAGCGSGSDSGSTTPTPTALNAEQAQALAIMRFNNYSAQTLPVRITSSGQVDIEAEVVLDLRQHIGFGTYQATEPGSDDVLATGLIAFDQAAIGTTAGGETPDERPLPAGTAWTARGYDFSSPIDASLAMALSLGSDRPENPALLQQSDARLLRTEGDATDPVWVIRGPSDAGAATDGSATDTEDGAGRTTYWIDADGNLSRYEAQLSNGADPTTIEVVDPDDVPARVPRRIVRQMKVVG